MRFIVELPDPAFFDEVSIEHQDEIIKNRRLKILNLLHAEFFRGDYAGIQVMIDDRPDP